MRVEILGAKIWHHKKKLTYWGTLSNEVEKLVMQKRRKIGRHENFMSTKFWKGEKFDSESILVGNFYTIFVRVGDEPNIRRTLMVSHEGKN